MKTHEFIFSWFMLSLGMFFWLGVRTEPESTHGLIVVCFAILYGKLCEVGAMK